MFNKNMKWAVSGTLFLLLIAGSMVVMAAGEQTKNYRWTVDRQMQLAGQMLEPGRYDVQVTYIDNQKAHLVVMLKEQTVVKADALLEPRTDSSGDDGVRVILPDGKTRVVQKLWFRSGKYLFNLDVPTNVAASSIQARP
jgi:hypothetical protein